MTNARREQGFIDAIDEALGERNSPVASIDEATSTRLCAIIDDSRQAGQSAPVLMHLAAHPVIDDLIASETLPDDLVAAMSGALHDSLDMYSEWTGAPLPVQLKRLPREFRRQKATYEAVCRRIDDGDQTEGAQLLKRYLDSEPAQYFSDQARACFSELARSIDI